MNKLVKLRQLTWGERLLLLEAWIYLGAARLALRLFPFRLIAPRLGEQAAQDDAPSSAAPGLAAARQVGSAVELAARHTPWESACLAQAVAGKLMLRRRGLASRLYLGTKKDGAGHLTAHAWLAAGNEILIGGQAHETFTVLGIFRDPPA